MGEILNLQIMIFALVALGFLVRKIGIVSEKGQSSINDLVIYLILPANILKAFLGSGVEGDLKGYLGIFLISVGVQVFCVLYGKLMFHRYPEGRRKCLQYGTICSNAGILGNPLAEGMYGAEGLVLASIYLIPLRTMMWSSGLATFSGTTDKKATLKKVATHPCILACVLGFVLMLAHVKPPESVMGVVNALGNCNTGMSMMVVGMILARVDFRGLWDPTVFLYSLHRLVIIPLIVYLAVLPLPVSDTARGLSVILAAMPAGATTSMLAEKYNMEPVFGTKLVVFSTLLSLPTIAVWSLILR